MFFAGFFKASNQCCYVCMARHASTSPNTLAALQCLLLLLLQENLDVLSWQLAEEDFAKLSALATQQRMVDGSYWVHPSGPYKTLEEFWDE